MSVEEWQRKPRLAFLWSTCQTGLVGRWVSGVYSPKLHLEPLKTQAWIFTMVLAICKLLKGGSQQRRVTIRGMKFSRRRASMRPDGELFIFIVRRVHSYNFFQESITVAFSANYLLPPQPLWLVTRGLFQGLKRGMSPLCSWNLYFADRGGQVELSACLKIKLSIYRNLGSFWHFG